MPGIKEIIQSLGPQEVQKIEDRLGITRENSTPYWQVPDTPQYRVVTKLLDTQHFQEILDSLTKPEMRLLQYLVTHGGDLTRQELLTVVSDGESTLESLRKKHVIFSNPELMRKTGWDVLSLPVEYQNHLRPLQTDNHVIGYLLQLQSSEYLTRVANHCRVDRASGKRTFLSLKIREKLLSPKFLKVQMEQLNDEELKILQMALKNDGVLSRVELVDKGLVKHGGIDYMSFRYRPEGPFFSLYEKALLFPSSEYQPSHFIVPSDLMEILSPRPKRVVVPAPSDKVPHHLDSFGSRILNDIRMLQAFEASGRLKTTQSGLPDKKALANFFDRLGVKNARYGAFVYSLAKPFVLKKSNQLAYFKNPTEMFFLTISEWKKSGQYNESTLGKTGKGHIHDETMPKKRDLVLQALANLPEGPWIATDEFVDMVLSMGWQRLDVPISRERFGYYSPPQPEKLTPRQTLLIILAESLVWLGLIEAGFSEDNEGQLFTHFKLTKWGRFVLEGKTGPFPDFSVMEPHSNFYVQPNRDIIIDPALQPDVLAKLFQFASPTGPHTLALTKESIQEALASEMPTKKILEFLSKHSKNGVPPNVERFVADIAKQHGRIQLGPAEAYLVVDEASLLSELQADPNIKKYLREELTDRVVLVHYYDLPKLDRALKKAGHLPKSKLTLSY